ncbi:hypothetical protein LIER_20923 [Lithospermum erythrorhizon]|uniref:Transmembrane protein 128 n=1 Tax=Lithospermum erythrorhizon TaxID=34254 RepID=A0AAV3QRQ6_LITER
MSAGIPNGGGYVRQRHSQGYASSSEDLEDDACSGPPPELPMVQRTRSWVEVLENYLWIGSAIFIIYYGDSKSNLIYLLWHDDRIRRIPLNIGMIGVSLNISYFMYTSMLVWRVKKSSEKWEFSSATALPIITLLGLLSFCLFSFALWPIWSFLTLPLVFTLFMACMVILPHLVLGTLKPQADLLRLD